MVESTRMVAPDTFGAASDRQASLNDEWLAPGMLLEYELAQLRQEDARIEDGLDARLRAALGSDPWDAAAIRSSYRELVAALDGDPPAEPNDLASIRRLRPGMPAAAPLPDLRERLLGAWTGRCVGCTLGKPVESLTPDEIRRYLKDHEAWPLDGYVPAAASDEDRALLHPSHPTTTRPNIAYMERDDDIDYAILNLDIAHRVGPGWSTGDVAEAWLRSLPYLGVFTAERVAYRNLLEGVPVGEAGFVGNPYREWIGAQIRADVWAYLHPGDPEAAADASYRDAILSHRKNGIYGEMLAAAMIARALVARGVEEILHAGLAVVPPASRLATAVEQVIGWHSEDISWEVCLQRILDTYPHHHWIHVLPNAAIVAMALLYSEGDFGRAITVTVMGGLDTDSNAATVGSIMGALVGPGGIPERWSAPLNDRVRSFLPGFDNSSISALAARTYELATGPFAREAGEAGTT